MPVVVEIVETKLIHLFDNVAFLDMKIRKIRLYLKLSMRKHKKPQPLNIIALIFLKILLFSLKILILIIWKQSL